MREQSIAQINKDLKRLSSQVNNLEVGINSKGVQKSLDSALKNIKPQKLEAVEIDAKDFKNSTDSISKAIKKYENEFKSSTSQVTKYIDKQNGEIKHLLLTLKDAQGTVRKMKLTPQFDNDGNIGFGAVGDVKETTKAYEQREKVLREEQGIRKKLLKVKQSEIEANEKLANQMADGRIKAKKEREELEYQIQKHKELAKHKRKDLERRYGSVLTPDQNNAMDKYIKNMNKITANTPNAKREIDKLNTGFKGIESNVKAAGGKVETFGSQLSTALKRIPIWIKLPIVHIKLS